MSTRSTEPVDNLGGILSVALVGALILASTSPPLPDMGTLVSALQSSSSSRRFCSLLRQRRAPNPLYDLQIAGRRVFWVAAVAGIIVFGSLMGAMFIGQQYLQNVLGYSTLDAGLAIIPAALAMVIVAPRSARLVEARGARFTLLVGYVFVLLGFADDVAAVGGGQPVLVVGLGYAFVGIGVGFAGTPASHSLTGSVPIRRAGMASGTADLQRDLGGALMQSIFGALLTAGYAAAVATEIAGDPDGAQVTASVQSQLQLSSRAPSRSPRSTRSTRRRSPPAPRRPFLAGDQWAYLAGIVAVLIGAAIVFFRFPARDRERDLLAEYHAEDAASPPPAVAAGAAGTGGLPEAAS